MMVSIFMKFCKIEPPQGWALEVEDVDGKFFSVKWTYYGIRRTGKVVVDVGWIYYFK